jgi:hypothetical protein
MKLPAHIQDGTGRLDYTAAGLADADLASAGMALDDVLDRDDLTPGQRRDFIAARRATRRAARAVGRQVDVEAIDHASRPGTGDGR